MKVFLISKRLVQKKNILLLCLKIGSFEIIEYLLFEYQKKYPEGFIEGTIFELERTENLKQLKKLKYSLLERAQISFLKENIIKVIFFLESKIIYLINNSEYLSLKYHILSEFIEIKSKKLEEILSERSIRFFDNIKDFENRMKFNLLEKIENRIFQELEKDNLRFYFFRKRVK